jgi:hypothetical protein
MELPSSSSVPPKPNLAALIETAAKASAILLGLVYTTGFLVVTVHHAKFGISDFNILRPRIVYAGLLFLLFTVLPAVSVSRDFGLLGLSLQTYSHPDGDKYKPHYYVVRAAMFWITAALALPLLLSWLYPATGPPESIATALKLPAILGLALAYTLFVNNYFYKHPTWSIAISFAVIIAIELYLSYYAGPNTSIIAHWFLLTGIGFLWVYRIIGKMTSFKTAKWEIGVLLAIGILVLFPLGVYDKVHAHFGGGLPVPVTMYLTCADPATSAMTLEAQLLDETPEGYYILHPNKKYSAIFIRRDSVRAIVFGRY